MEKPEPKFEDKRFNEIQNLISEIEKEYSDCTHEEIMKATQTALSESQSVPMEELKQKIKSNLSWGKD
jgi:lipoate-protein ligase A